MDMLQLALEDNPDGRVEVEKELVFYAKITDFSFLETATKHEIHEQWEIKVPKSDDNAGPGRFRIRKVTADNGEISYFQTTKTKAPTGGEFEVCNPTSKDNFDAFEIFCSKGMFKHRYTFQIEGSELKWEVDCFSDPNKVAGGDAIQFAEWVKVDLEISVQPDSLPPFPFVSEHIIDNNNGLASAEDKKIIDYAYENIFIRKNKYS